MLSTNGIDVPNVSMEAGVLSNAQRLFWRLPLARQQAALDQAVTREKKKTGNRGYRSPWADEKAQSRLRAADMKKPSYRATPIFRAEPSRKVLPLANRSGGVNFWPDVARLGREDNGSSTLTPALDLGRLICRPGGFEH